MYHQLTKVAIHGVPRSGTSWVGEIFNSSPCTVYRFQPLFSYAFKDYLTNASTRDEIDSFFRELKNTEDNFLNQNDKRQSGEFPQFSKLDATHVVYKEVRYINILCNMMRRSDDVYLCAVIRNPLSVINSWLRAPREFRRDLGWSESAEWRYALKKNLNRPEEFNGYEKWKEAALTFRHLKAQYPSRVSIVRYSDLLMRPLEESAKLFDAVSLPITGSTKEFLTESTTKRNSDPYSVFRVDQRDDKWKSQLDQTIAEQILDDIQGSDLQEYVQEIP